MPPYFPVDRALKQGSSTPVQDLVNNLINISNNREQEARRKRLEERQSRLDAMNAEEVARQQQLKDFEVGQQAELLKVLPDLIKSSAEAQSMLTAEPGAVPSEQAKAIMKTGPDGQKETRFEGPVPEVLDQMKAGFKGRELMSNEPVDTLDQTLPVTPQGTPDAIPLAPTSPAPEVAPHQQPYERGYGDLNLFGIDEPVPFQNREEVLGRMQQEAMVSPSVLSALARAGRPGSTKGVIQVQAGDRIELRDPETLELLETVEKGIAPKSASAARDATAETMKSYTLMEDKNIEGKQYNAGQTVLLTNAEAKEMRNSISVGKTAEMRNMEYQAGAVAPAFDLMEQSLNNLEKTTESIGGKLKGILPGTDSYYAKDRFQKQAIALAGAIVARQAGEGSRLSDEDRRAYSKATTLVNDLILLPGGIKEARDRLTEARALIDEVQQRRSIAGTGAGIGTQSEVGSGAGTPDDPIVLE